MGDGTIGVHAVAVIGRDGQPAYQLRLPQFEGPLDVLLMLIERRELEVTAISLATVADQFLERVAALPGDRDLLADFVAMAARLVLIKSRALLPRPAGPADAPDDEADDAAALARQLADYRQARATALALAERLATGQIAYGRAPSPPPTGAEPPPLAPVSLADLVRAVRRRLLAGPTEPARAELTPVVSLPEKIAQIEAMLSRSGRTTLSELLDLAPSRPEVIVTFIALLELIRRRSIQAEQSILFGDIVIAPATRSA